MSSDNSYDSADYDSDDSYDRNDDSYDMNDEEPSVGTQKQEKEICTASTPPTTNKSDTKKTTATPERFAMKNYCDVPSSSSDPENHEQRALIVSRDERLSITIKFKKELNDIKNKRKDLASGVDVCKRMHNIRKRIVSTILASAKTTYATEEHEYQAIGKFYRGMFRKVAYNDSRPRKDRLFDDTEQAILIEIARAYGAFGY